MCHLTHKRVAQGAPGPEEGAKDAHEWARLYFPPSFSVSPLFKGNDWENSESQSIKDDQ